MRENQSIDARARLLRGLFDGDHAFLPDCLHCLGEDAHRIRDFSCFWCERIHAGKHPLSVCPECVARYSTLHLLKMRGSYLLNGRAIDEALTPGRVGNADTRYTHFAYSYSHSAAAAFAKESCNFEDFGGSGALDNQVEPVSMAG
jgi:hypothetical protein